MSFVDYPAKTRKIGPTAIWHTLCEGMTKRFTTRNAMFTKPLSAASKLDKAIMLSITAMLAMNVVVLANQLDAAPVVAQSTQPVAAAQQA